MPRSLAKLLSKATSAPVHSLYGGQSAIDLVEASKPDEQLLFLLDWHMPDICGLMTTESVRRIARERGGPSIHICMVTADIEGLQSEMRRREMSHEGIVSKEGIIECINDDSNADFSENISVSYEKSSGEDRLAAIDLVAGSQSVLT